LQTLYSISEAIGVNRLFAYFNRNQPIVLAFHGVTADAPGNICNHEGKHLYLPIFEALMEHMAHHYHVVPLSRVVDWMSGETDIPARAVALTFDDGYRNVFTEAAPVLKRLGLPATLFVVTDFVFEGRMLWPDWLMSALAASDVPAMRVQINGSTIDCTLGSDREKRQADARLSAACKRLREDEKLAFLDRVVSGLRVSDEEIRAAWADHAPIRPDELACLADYGIEVGSHTCSHGIVTRFDPEAMTRELTVSRRLIEEATNRSCTQFSYPNGSPGDFSADTRARVIAAGYGCAVTTIKRRVSRSDDVFEIPRCILTHNEITTAEFSAHVSGFPAFLRAVRDRVRPLQPEAVPA